MARGTIRIYDVKTHKWVHTLEGHTDSVVGVAYSADDRWIASASTDQTAKIWDAKRARSCTRSGATPVGSSAWPLTPPAAC